MSESESDALPLGDTPICFALYHEYFCFSIAKKGKRKELHFQSKRSPFCCLLFYSTKVIVAYPFPDLCPLLMDPLLTPPIYPAPPPAPPYPPPPPPKNPPPPPDQCPFPPLPKTPAFPPDPAVPPDDCDPSFTSGR